ncbi:hypothetical protein HAX54_013816, partial [Datura stramonium]|nr:hypothetical protein [Datura stramonium]
ANDHNMGAKVATTDMRQSGYNSTRKAAQSLLSIGKEPTKYRLLLICTTGCDDIDVHPESVRLACLLDWASLQQSLDRFHDLTAVVQATLQ